MRREKLFYDQSFINLYAFKHASFFMDFGPSTISGLFCEKANVIQKRVCRHDILMRIQLDDKGESSVDKENWISIRMWRVLRDVEGNKREFEDT